MNELLAKGFSALGDDSDLRSLELVADALRRVGDEEVRALLGDAATYDRASLDRVKAIPLASGLLPRSVLELRGDLSSKEPQDAVMSLSLVRRSGSVIDGVLLRAADFHPDTQVFERLAIAGAAWSRHTLLADTQLEESVLGARDWRSSARFGTAAALRAADLKLSARTLYASALDADPRNVAASYNLALLDIGDGEYERADKRLRDTKAALNRASVATPLDRHPAWFSTTYNLAAVQLYIKATGGAVTVHRKNAWKLARELVLELIRVRAKVTDPGLHDRDRLLFFLDGIEAAAFVLLASATLEVAHEPGDVPADAPMPSEWRNDFARRLAAMKPPPHDMPPGIHRLSPREIVERFVRRGFGDLQPRTRYNLACFYCRVGRVSDGGTRDRAFNHALEELGFAIDLVGRAWPQRDPALEPLRQARADKFAKCIGEEKQQEAPALALAGLDAITEAEAKNLKDRAQVETFGELLRRAAGSRDRRQLGTLIRRPTPLLTHWAELAELATADAFTLAEVNLLDEARCGSIRNLRESEAGLLTETLAALAAIHDPPLDAPSPGRVQAMVEAARQTRSVVAHQ